jgi:putative membrane protein
MKKGITRFVAIMSIMAGSLLTISAVAQDNKLSDAEIASVAVVANQIDIDAARLAQQKSKDATVVEFAKTMISDHQSVIEKASALVKKLGVTPKDNALSQQLLASAEKTKKSLLAKSGQAFNRAYVDNEVAYHQAVIAAVEGRLIPEATNQELKDLLQSVLPVLRTHLEHAQMVQKNVAAK